MPVLSAPSVLHSLYTLTPCVHGNAGQACWRHWHWWAASTPLLRGPLPLMPPSSPRPQRRPPLRPPPLHTPGMMPQTARAHPAVTLHLSGMIPPTAPVRPPATTPCKRALSSHRRPQRPRCCPLATTPLREQVWLGTTQAWGPVLPSGRAMTPWYPLSHPEPRGPCWATYLRGTMPCCLGRQW
jgi:hypothetical protein